MTNEVDPLQAFDKKVLKHFTHDGAGALFRGTRAALVKGNDLYIGIAQCVSFDQFNRRKGRQIAKGRALQAWKEDAGVSGKQATRRHSGQFYFKVSVNSPEEIDAALAKHVFLDEPRPTK